MIAWQASGSRAELRGRVRPALVLFAMVLLFVVGWVGLKLLGGGTRDRRPLASAAAVETASTSALGFAQPPPPLLEEETAVQRSAAGDSIEKADAGAEDFEPAYLDAFVIDVDTGRPRREVMVNVLRPRENGEGWELEDQRSSDEAGLASFALRAGVEYQLYTSKSFRLFSAGTLVKLEPDERRRVRLAFRSYQAGRFVGMVVGPDGFPIPGARIKVLDALIQAGDFGRDLGRTTYFEMEVDPSGIFEIHHNPGRDVTAFASAPGHVRRPFVVHGSWDITKPFLIRLPKEVRAEFSVVSQHGAPLANVEVTLLVNLIDLLQEPAPHEPYLRAKPRWRAATDEDGRCRFEGLPPDTPIYVRIQPLPDRRKWFWQTDAKELPAGMDSSLEVVVEI